MTERGTRQPGELTLDLADGPAGEVAHRLAHPVDNLVEQVAMLLEILEPLGGHLVDLLSVALDASDVSLVLEHLQGGVNRAGRRAVAPGHPLLERLDDFVPVA